MKSYPAAGRELEHMTIDLIRQRDELTTAIAKLVATIQEIRRDARGESLLRQSSRESVSPKEAIRVAERRKAQIAEAQTKLMETQSALGAVNKAIRVARNDGVRFSHAENSPREDLHARSIQECFHQLAKETLPPDEFKRLEKDSRSLADLAHGMGLEDAL